MYADAACLYRSPPPMLQDGSMPWVPAGETPDIHLRTLSSARYCSKDCQRSAWHDHKQTCTAPATRASRAPTPTQLAFLLGEGFSAKSCQVPKAPLSIAVVKHHFSKHHCSKDADFTDVLMPVSDRLFQRPMRIMYDKTAAGNLQRNTFATRDACSLQMGLALTSEVR